MTYDINYLIRRLYVARITLRFAVRVYLETGMMPNAKAVIETKHAISHFTARIKAMETSGNGK